MLELKQRSKRLRCRETLRNRKMLDQLNCAMDLPHGQSWSILLKAEGKDSTKIRRKDLPLPTSSLYYDPITTKYGSSDVFLSIPILLLLICFGPTGKVITNILLFVLILENIHQYSVKNISKHFSCNSLQNRYSCQVNSK